MYRFTSSVFAVIGGRRFVPHRSTFGARSTLWFSTLAVLSSPSIRGPASRRRPVRANAVVPISEARSIPAGTSKERPSKLSRPTVRVLQRSGGDHPIPRGNPAQNRPLRDDIRVIFGALKGRAHVAMTMRDGLAKKTARRQRFLVGEKNASRAPKTTPKPSACRGTSTGPRVARFASRVLW